MLGAPSFSILSHPICCFQVPYTSLSSMVDKSIGNSGICYSSICTCLSSAKLRYAPPYPYMSTCTHYPYTHKLVRSALPFSAFIPRTAFQAYVPRRSPKQATSAICEICCASPAVEQPHFFFISCKM